MPPILFNRYVFHKGEQIPSNLDIRGAVACTRDSKHQGLLHIIFFVAQKIHNFLFHRKDDVNMAHWMIILGNSAHPYSHPVAHAIYPSIKTDCRSYLDPASPNSVDVTELVVYIPKNPILRNLIADNAEHSAHDEDRIGLGINDGEKISFSIGDIVKGFFHKPSIQPSKRSLHRSALTMADLLHSSVIKNRKNTPRALFCNPYSSFITQSSLLINSLTLSERNDYTQKPRNELSKILYKRIKKPNPQDFLSKTYWENPICRIDSRFAFSSFTSTIMDSQSQIIK